MSLRVAEEQLFNANIFFPLINKYLVVYRVLAVYTYTHTYIHTSYVFIIFCNISREAGNNVQYIWSYYSVAELKKMMDAFDAWEGKGIVQFFYFMAEGRLCHNKTK